jgi:oligopeptide transport system substrate-binding protein
MVKNDKYWDKDSTKTTQVTFRLMNDPNAVYAAFKNKEIDFDMNLFPTDERTTIQQTPEYQKLPYVGLYYVQFNNIAVAK